MSTHIVMKRSAQMPSSCWGRYGRVAVCEVADPDNPPKMISARAKGMIRIVREWDKLHIGGARSAFALACGEAESLCAKLNGETER